MNAEPQHLTLGPGDALIVVDVQNDFLPGGTLAVPQGDEVIPVLNEYIAMFEEEKLPIIATRDWHPENHCSFTERGGIWPTHCIADTEGAAFHEELKLAKDTLAHLQGHHLPARGLFGVRRNSSRRNVEGDESATFVHRRPRHRLLCAQHGEGCIAAWVRSLFPERCFASGQRQPRRWRKR
jgi:hypothetical protein